MFFKRLLYYLNPFTLFRKRDDGTGNNINITLMHGINRITILVFLICLVVMLIKFVL